MAKYDPHKHHRRSIRLKGWDYRSPAFYFVTICTHQRENLFENPVYYEIAMNALLHVPEQPHAQHVRLDESIIMPNHEHIVFEFMDWPGGVKPEPATAVSPDFQNALAGSLGVIVGRYKTAVTTPINNLRQAKGTAVWQRGYYERIIRNERELQATQQYIIDNPIRRAEDRDNLAALLTKMTYHKNDP
jgi:REP element-mobilizing transposase RayT